MPSMPYPRSIMVGVIKLAIKLHVDLVRLRPFIPCLSLSLNLPEHCSDLNTMSRICFRSTDLRHRRPSPNLKTAIIR